MNDQSFNLETFILKSSHKDYIENEYKNILVKNKIGEGSYGIVFLIENDHIMKIFKNSLFNKTILTESNYLIPIKNENRELIFYYKYINDKKENNYIINLYSIGLIKNEIKDKTKNITNIFGYNSYFIILPLCQSFYNIYNINNIPLIDKNNGIAFTLLVMKRLGEIAYFFEKKYNLINLDFKLSNFMFTTKNNYLNNLNNLVMLDFSIIKKNNKKKYIIEKKYYIWPNLYNNILIETLPSYSICINGLELLFGHNNILNLPDDNKINKYLKIIEKKNKNIYKIFYDGLILKINTEKFMKLIKNYHTQ